MKQRMRSVLVLLLLVSLLSSCAPIKEHEALDRLQEMVGKGTEILEEIRTSIKEEIENLRESIQDIVSPEAPATETPNPEQTAFLGESLYQMEPFANRQIRVAFLALPDRYDYVFDSAAEEENFRLLNEYRQEKGLPMLLWRNDLAQAARYKSLAMLQHDYFSHDNPNLNNAAFDELLWTELNLKYTGIGENLAFIAQEGAKNNIPAADLFKGWQESPGHNAQMLSKDHRFVGIGVVRGMQSGPYYKGYKPLIGTQHFGF